MPKSRSVDIVVPVYNNAPTLRALAKRCHASVASLGQDCRMVFVNDASKDSSRAVLAEIQTDYPETCIINLAENGGQQNAIRTALPEIRDIGIIMDADLQDPPEAIPALIKELESGPFDVVFGTRRGRYQSRARMLTSRVYRRLLRGIVALPPGSGGFLAMTARVSRDLAAYDGSHFYLVGLIGCGQHRISDVAVERDPRGDTNSSQYTFSSRLSLGMRNMKTVLWERLRHVKN